MRTAEHMEHRNLERKWRPSLVLGPHLTEGRLNDERKSCCVCVCVCASLPLQSLPSRVASLVGVDPHRLRRGFAFWGPCGFIARDPLNSNPYQ